MATLSKVRIDKWLWSVRIFKSRTQATDACKAGKVKINGSSVKASTYVEVGNMLEVRKNGFDMIYEVKKLIEKRVSATLAEPCYVNLTPAEELNKYSAWYIGKSGAEKRAKGEGRPTKRDRRTLDKFKNFR